MSLGQTQFRYKVSRVLQGGSGILGGWPLGHYAVVDVGHIVIRSGQNLKLLVSEYRLMLVASRAVVSLLQVLLS